MTLIVCGLALCALPVAGKQRRPKKAVSTAGSPEELIARARRLYELLEYPAVVKVADAVLARSDAPVELRVDASYYKGCSLAVLGDSIGAEAPFRLVLRARPDFELPAGTPPKIVHVFSKVAVEEGRMRQQIEKLQLAKIIDALELAGETDAESVGGTPIVFDYRLRDPFGAVDRVRVQYRRGSDGDYSALALSASPTGGWQGEISAGWTETDNGFEIEYYVTTEGADGHPLVALGGPAEPFVIHVTAGTIADTIPLHQRPWVWIVAGVVAVGAGVGGYFIHRARTDLPNADAMVDLAE